jgi:hypothetical protein
MAVMSAWRTQLRYEGLPDGLKMNIHGKYPGKLQKMRKKHKN